MKLAWLDLETTGLDEKSCSILEAAVCMAEFTDPFTVLSRYQRVLYFFPDKVSSFDPYVVEMHTKNGLFKECANSYYNVASVEQELLQIIPDIADKDEKTTLAGSSVHFDHKFIATYMPVLNRRLSHRHYDVSALKLDCQS
jgi:oligoribonuclease